MTWEQGYRLRLAACTSLVLWAGASLIAALACARGIWWFDRQIEWRLFGFSPDGARAVLGTLVGSMLTFIVFVLSATLIVVQLASGQLTPRVIGMVFAVPWVRVTLGVFTFTYAYTLAALGRVEERVPDLHVGVAVLLNVVFFLFVQRLSNGLRPSAMLRLVAARGRKVVTEVYPAAFDPAQPEQPVGAAIPNTPPQGVKYDGPFGVVMAFSAERLARLARDADAVVQLVPQVGDSIAPGDLLFRTYGGTSAALSGCIAIGPERTIDQDPRFAFRILVDIANRALSPGINDPTTAVLALDQIDNLLLWLGKRRLDEGVLRDPNGSPRVVYGTPDWPDYVTLAVSEIRHYGEGSIQVSRRLRAMLERLIRELPDARRSPLEEELALLGNSAKRRFRDEADLRRAEAADNQGLGGSDS